MLNCRPQTLGSLRNNQTKSMLQIETQKARKFKNVSGQKTRQMKLGNQIHGIFFWGGGTTL